MLNTLLSVFLYSCFTFLVTSLLFMPAFKLVGFFQNVSYKEVICKSWLALILFLTFIYSTFEMWEALL